MKKLAVILTLMLVSLNSFSYAEPTNVCTGQTSIFGGPGGDSFPWSDARPFPWSTIQGTWVNKDPFNQTLVFIFKVTRSTDKVKQLYAEVYDARECVSASKSSKLKGVGFLSSSERNVVRLNMNNILVKLALFKSEDLDINKYVCGQTTLGATLYRLDQPTEFDSGLLIRDTDLEDLESTSYLLKKISNSTEYKCKR